MEHMQCQFCCILYLEAVSHEVLPRVKGLNVNTCLMRSDKILEDHVRLEIISWLFGK